jgi:trimeric autotransporter adhesin
MSTKTTFKRIALVAVAAMGFGVLTSVTPASANTDSGFSVGYTSLTVVGAANAGTAFLPVNITAPTGGPAGLQATESITAQVIAWPTAIDSTTAASDINITVFQRTANNTFAAVTGSPNTATVASGAGAARVGSNSVASNVASVTDSGTALAGTYWFGFKSAATKAVDKGTYTVRFRFTGASGFITSVSVPVTFVTSAADSGAAITVAQTGNLVSGESVTMTATRRLSATLTNGVAGGRVQMAINDTTIGIPTLVAASWAGATPVVIDGTTEWSVLDDGSQVNAAGILGDFTSTTASDSKTAWTSAANGVYGITSADMATAAVTLNQTSVSPYLRVTFGSTAATVALTVINAPSQTAAPTVVFNGVGALTASTPFTLPLTTKTASFSISGATPGNSYSYSVAYTSVAAGDQSPLGATATTVFANSAGVITVPVTVANPVDGASAVVTVTGFTTNPAAQTINWARSKATTLTVDMGGATVALKATTVFTATVVDAFGAPVSGVLLQPSLAATGSNGSATLVLPTVTTGANGQATYSLTDTKAVAAGTDTVTFTGVGTTGMAAASAVITYAATAPAPTTLTPYVSTTPLASNNDLAIRVAPSATGVYRTGTDAFDIQKARNNSVATSVSDTADQIRVVVSAGVAGAAITATASEGAYVLNGANFQVRSRTLYTGTTGFAPSFVVGSNKTGANTVTFTSGAATTTVAFWVENTGTDARFVTLAQASAGSPVVATVTDRYGNGVSGASVQISTSAGTLGNGQMTTVYTTDLSGKVSVIPVGSDSAVITAIATATNAEHAALAGFAASGAQIDSTVAAGNSTATLTVQPAASAVDVAQAATDAAAEATDAANAATDAANAAAEAADAATAAAQDAADAVAALSTQVTELVSALRKQITSLTNLVIKIQRKVRA